MKRLLLVGLGLVLFVGTLVLGWNFAAANAATIEIDLLWITLVEISVWKLVIASFALGGTIVGTTFGFLWLHPSPSLQRRLRPLRALPARGVSSWRLAERKALSTQGKLGL